MISLDSFDEGDKIGFAHHENGNPYRGIVERTARVVEIRLNVPRPDWTDNDLTVLEVEAEDGTWYRLEQSDDDRRGDSVSVERVRVPPYEDLGGATEVEKMGS